MIKIQRASCPDCLSDAPAEGTTYRKRAVVGALWKMQHGKCCYSEMPIPDEGHNKAVEHFHPQSKFKWLRNEWTNLLLVSPQCNGRKRELFPIMLTDEEKETKVVYVEKAANGSPAIIDPSDPSVDPEEHLTYVMDDSDPLCAQVIARDNSPLGDETIAVCGIDDEFFLRLRLAHYSKILLGTYRNILSAKADGNMALLDVELRSFQQHMDSQSEFAGLAREFARQRKLDSNFGLTIPGPKF